MTHNPNQGVATKTPKIVLSRVFAAPRATVFAAWSSAEHVSRWFCPRDYSVPHARVQMQVGGAFEVCMRSPHGTDHWTRGHFTEVAPHDRLVIEMNVMGQGDHLLFSAHTEVAFADDAGGTRLDVTQTYALVDPAALAMIQGASEGWNQTLDRLATELARMREGNEAGRSVVHAIFNLERVYDAPLARVWQAFTDVEAKAKWFSGAQGQWELLERRMDVGMGGRERLKGRWQSGLVTTFDAFYHDVVPNERLVYSYDMYLDDRKISVSLATIQFKPEGTGTRLTVTEQGAFLDGYDDAGSRERGTAQLLDGLAASLR